MRGLLHGAGVLADRRIDDQTVAQFREVFATKVVGLRNVLDALGAEQEGLRLLVLFSSSTARFGRIGQVAYAAANEVLNKKAVREARTRPGCRVLSINWGPWDGGMVTDALKPLFLAEGIGLIEPEAGARFLIDEIQIPDAPARSIEVVVLGGSRLPEGLIPRRETPAKSTGVGLNPTPVVANDPQPVFELTADVAALPVLRSHVIDGRPVVPMALILEWLAHGALQRNPGLVFHGFEEARLLKGVIVRGDMAAPEVLRVLAGKASRGGTRTGAGDGYTVPVELRGIQPDGREFVHARGTVVLGDRLPVPSPEQVSLWASGARTSVTPRPDLDPRVLYREVLFHGPDLRSIDRIEGCDDQGIIAVCRPAPLRRAGSSSRSGQRG